MELGNNRWPDTRMIKNVCQSLFEAPPHQLVSHSPLSWKFTSEYGFDQVLAYKLDALETSTASRFQISSYHDLEATQIKYISSVLCRQWSMISLWYWVTSAPYSSQHPKLHRPHRQALACQRHYDVASAFCVPSFLSGFWHLSCANVTWNKARKPHWHK